MAVNQNCSEKWTRLYWGNRLECICGGVLEFILKKAPANNCEATAASICINVILPMVYLEISTKVPLFIWLFLLHQVKILIFLLNNVIWCNESFLYFSSEVAIQPCFKICIKLLGKTNYDTAMLQLFQKNHHICTHCRRLVLISCITHKQRRRNFP